MFPTLLLANLGHCSIMQMLSRIIHSSQHCSTTRHFHWNNTCITPPLFSTLLLQTDDLAKWGFSMAPRKNPPCPTHFVTPPMQNAIPHKTQNSKSSLWTTAICSFANQWSPIDPRAFVEVPFSKLFARQSFQAYYIASGPRICLN